MLPVAVPDFSSTVLRGGAAPGRLIFLWGSETVGTLSPLLPGLESVGSWGWAVRDVDRHLGD